MKDTSPLPCSMPRRHVLSGFAATTIAGTAALAGTGIHNAIAARPAHAAGFDMEKALAVRIIGKPDAPIHIAEYFSLSCGHCAAFHKATFGRIKSDWVETGKARFEYRDFPLGAAAVYAHALARAVPHDAYDGMLTTLFNAREQWLSGDDPVAALENIARLAGIGSTDFRAIIGNRPYLEAIVAAGQKGHDEYGINSTPSFVINNDRNEVIRGNVGYDEFTETLNLYT